MRGRVTRLGRCLALLAITLATGSRLGIALVEAGGQGVAGPPDGRRVYDSACAACHGSDGRGVSPSLLGFDTPIPDFTDCSFSTVEPDEDWTAVSHDGGPARGFSRRMPAFGEDRVRYVINTGGRPGPFRVDVELRYQPMAIGGRKISVTTMRWRPGALSRGTRRCPPARPPSWRER